ncbi:MAG TPA: YggS family pyridoxal phosphate-dependent enzyme [Candidatus Saccharimonadales bacterium]|nr:YggS family pyridoxal phosphate-dependent enzyme [Candidatus Saccharimonadales bacterium]
MSDPSASVDALRAAHSMVLERIASAAARVGRDPAGVTLVAVSKTVEAARIRDAYRAGLRTFGENRVQEALAKQPEIHFRDIEWHLVGPLQSNKARKAIDAFDVIQTVDSVGLARRLDLLGGDIQAGHAAPDGAIPAAPFRHPVLLQVNVDGDPAKAGFRPEDVAGALGEIAGMAHVRVEGLMTVGRFVEEAEAARPTFRALRELSERLRADGADLGPALSMGMTDDFEIAVEEGATIVRVGRALFGERPHHHGDGAVEHAH